MEYVRDGEPGVCRVCHEQSNKLYNGVCSFCLCEQAEEEEKEERAASILRSPKMKAGALSRFINETADMEREAIEKSKEASEKDNHENEEEYEDSEESENTDFVDSSKTYWKRAEATRRMVESIKRRDREDEAKEEDNRTYAETVRDEIKEKLKLSEVEEKVYQTALNKVATRYTRAIDQGRLKVCRVKDYGLSSENSGVLIENIGGLAVFTTDVFQEIDRESFVMGARESVKIREELADEISLSEEDIENAKNQAHIRRGLQEIGINEDEEEDRLLDF